MDLRDFMIMVLLGKLCSYIRVMTGVFVCVCVVWQGLFILILQFKNRCSYWYLFMQCGAEEEY